MNVVEALKVLILPGNSLRTKNVSLPSTLKLNPSSAKPPPEAILENLLQKEVYTVKSWSLPTKNEHVAMPVKIASLTSSDINVFIKKKEKLFPFVSIAAMLGIIQLRKGFLLYGRKTIQLYLGLG